MAGFVPKKKMSKKAQKELNRQRRVTWECSPVTKTVDSRKVYNRKRKAHDRYEDYGRGFFHIRIPGGSETRFLFRCRIWPRHKGHPCHPGGRGSSHWDSMFRIQAYTSIPYTC